MTELFVQCTENLSSLNFFDFSASPLSLIFVKILWTFVLSKYFFGVWSSLAPLQFGLYYEFCFYLFSWFPWYLITPQLSRLLWSAYNDWAHDNYSLMESILSRMCLS